MPFTLPRLQVLRMLLDHADDVPEILEAAEAVYSAQGIGAKIDAATPLLQSVRPIAVDIESLLADGLGFAAAADALAEEMFLCGAAQAKGINWDRLKKLLPYVEAALKLLLPLVLSDDSEG